MTIIRCPRCRDEVTAPAKASRLAIVRCPLCLEEYPLADALRNMPPELIVLGQAAEAAPAEAEGAASDWEAAAAAPDFKVSGGAAVFDDKPGAGVAMPTVPVAKGVRPRRKQGSGFGTLVGIIFGGLAGISLAVLILWWVFRRDIGFGPTVAKIPYIKWIVPKEFRDDEGVPSTNGSTQPANLNAAARATNGSSKPRPGATSATGGGSPNVIEPGPFAGPGNASPVAQAGGLSPDLLPDLTNLIPASTPPSPAITVPAPAVAAPAPPTADDFKQAVLTAGDALARYDASGGDGTEARQAKFTEMYVAVAEMGRGTTLLNLDETDLEGTVKEMQSLLNKLAGVGGSNKLSSVRFLAATNWAERKHGEGLLVAGHVKEFKAVGPQFEVTLDATLRGAALSIPLICNKNPQDFCQPEDELVVVGRIIDEPKSNLPGYDGTHPRVLMLGYCVKAPKSPKAP